MTFSEHEGENSLVRISFRLCSIDSLVSRCFLALLAFTTPEPIQNRIEPSHLIHIDPEELHAEVAKASKSLESAESAIQKVAFPSSLSRYSLQARYLMN